MDGLLNLFTAFGLSTSAGLNAYLPLLVVALLSRFTKLITLNPPWDTLESWWVIGVLVVIALYAFIVWRAFAIAAMAQGKRAAHGIDLNTDVSTLDAQVTGAGDVRVVNDGDLLGDLTLRESTRCS